MQNCFTSSWPFTNRFSFWASEQRGVNSYRNIIDVLFLWVKDKVGIKCQFLITELQMSMRDFCSDYYFSFKDYVLDKNFACSLLVMTKANIHQIGSLPISPNLTQERTFHLFDLLDMRLLQFKFVGLIVDFISHERWETCFSPMKYIAHLWGLKNMLLTCGE